MKLISTKARSAFALVASTLLAGCSSQKFYLSSPHTSPSGNDNIVRLVKGEKTAAIKIKRGLIWGGYEPGLMASDSSIVKVDYEEHGRTARTYLTGLSTGTSQVFFVNAFLINRDADSFDTQTFEDFSQELASFWVLIEE